MIYIKKFENSYTQYKIGDFVRVLTKNKIIDDIRDFVNSNTGKIVYIDNSLNNNSYPYEIEFPENIPNRNNSKFVFTKKEISRLATPEEIEMFNIKKEMSKYNL